jgi:hypothetical protein
VGGVVCVGVWWVRVWGCGWCGVCGWCGGCGGVGGVVGVVGVVGVCVVVCGGVWVVWWGWWGWGWFPLAFEHSKVCTLCDFGHLQFTTHNITLCILNLTGSDTRPLYEELVGLPNHSHKGLSLAFTNNRHYKGYFQLNKKRKKKNLFSTGRAQLNHDSCQLTDFRQCQFANYGMAAIQTAP